MVWHLAESRYPYGFLNERSDKSCNGLNNTTDLDHITEIFLAQVDIGTMENSHLREISSAQVDNGTTETLRHKIFDALEQSAVERLKFLPEGKLQELITAEYIEPELLRACPDITADARTELVHFITSQAKRGFATLVASKMVPVIERFYKYGFTDKYLPVRCAFQGSNWVAEHPNAVLSGKFFLERDEIQDFRDMQWLFLAPVFTIHCWEYILEEDHPLPFLRLPMPKKSTSRETLFSKVEQYMIHSDHLQPEGVSTG